MLEHRKGGLYLMPLETEVERGWKDCSVSASLLQSPWMMKTTVQSPWMMKTTVYHSSITDVSEAGDHQTKEVRGRHHI
jgi:hypothetical protein